MNTVKRDWECRYSSSEMMHLKVNDEGTEAHMYLDHAPTRGARWSADQILRGEISGEAYTLFGATIGEELKAAVRSLQANPIRPETEADKQAQREARRREPWPPKKAGAPDSANDSAKGAS